jgi:hypothetical protein
VSPNVDLTQNAVVFDLLFEVESTVWERCPAIQGGLDPRQQMLAYWNISVLLNQNGQRVVSARSQGEPGFANVQTTPLSK